MNPHEPTGDGERIRQNPSAYLRDWHTKGPLAVLQDLVACALIEILPRQRKPTLSIEVLGPLSFVITDNGRGMNFAPEPGQPVSHVEYVMTHLYPIPVPDPALVEILQRWTWGQRSCLGPVIGNALSSQFRIESQRGGPGWAQDYAFGKAQAPAHPIPETSHGTTQRVTLHEPLFRDHPPLTKDSLSECISTLRPSLPRLHVTLLSSHENGSGSAASS